MAGSGSGKPVCTVLGGANGSGKSSIYMSLPVVGRLINAGVVARAINPDRPETASLAAGRRVVEDLERALRERESFVYETTLSSRQSLGLMRRARDAGFEVGLIFVCLADAALCVERVAQRVARGGHDIPEDTIRRRYEVAFRRLADAIGLADGVAVYDNSDPVGPDLVARIERRATVSGRLDPARPSHLRLARAIIDATGWQPPWA